MMMTIQWVVIVHYTSHRYTVADIHAFLPLSTDDHCRVVLSVLDENGSDYINASYINVSCK